VALQLLFFLTPIIYQISRIPSSWHGLPVQAMVRLNPISVYVDSLRQLVYDLQVPSFMTWVQVVAWAAVAVGLAVLVYRWRGLDIGEAI
jgi:ABC-type polysaccharide/polyol phosphate export permease